MQLSKDDSLFEGWASRADGKNFLFGHFGGFFLPNVGRTIIHILSVPWWAFVFVGREIIESASLSIVLISVIVASIGFLRVPAVFSESIISFFGVLVGVVFEARASRVVIGGTIATF
jgi:hypothetical protein